MATSTNRHKWVKDEKGKRCTICDSRINNTPAYIRYLETDVWGIKEAVTWVPRCLYNQALKSSHSKLNK